MLFWKFRLSITASRFGDVAVVVGGGGVVVVGGGGVVVVVVVVVDKVFCVKKEVCDHCAYFFPTSAYSSIVPSWTLYYFLYLFRFFISSGQNM